MQCLPDMCCAAWQFLRGLMHLRPRTNTIGAVARIRNALSWATHDFFQSHGFLYLHTPLITTSDCEGAGEMFQVSSKLKSSVLTTPSYRQMSSLYSHS